MPISEPTPDPSAPPSTQGPEPAPTGAATVPESAGERPARPLWFSWALAATVVAVLAGAAIFLLGGSDDGGGTDDVATADATSAASAPGGADGAAGFDPGARGTITEIDGATIIVESTSPDGSSATTTVETTDETTITESVDGSLDDFAVGDTVVAFGEAEESGAVVATSVSEGGGGGLGRPQGGGELPEGFVPPTDGQFPEGFEPPADGELPEGFEPPADGELPDGFQPPQGGGGPGGQGAPTSGEITEIGDDSLTIETEDGSSVTVSITADTTFTVTEERSLDDLAEGDTIVATGEAGEEDVVNATTIRVGEDLGFGFGGPGGAPGATPGSVPSTDGEA